jgi:hypothetical protein
MEVPNIWGYLVAQLVEALPYEQVQFLTVSPEFFIDIVLVDTLQPQV